MLLHGQLLPPILAVARRSSRAGDPSILPHRPLRTGQARVKGLLQPPYKTLSGTLYRTVYRAPTTDMTRTRSIRLHDLAKFPPPGRNSPVPLSRLATTLLRLIPRARAAGSFCRTALTLPDMLSKYMGGH